MRTTRWLVTVGLLLAALAGHTQSVQGTSLNSLVEKLKTSRIDTDRIEILLARGEIFRLRIGNEKADMDSAMYYAKQSEQLSTKSGYKDGLHKSHLLMVNTLLEQEDIAGIKNWLTRLSPGETSLTILTQLSRYYLEKPGTDHEDMDSAHYYAQMAIQQSRSIGSKNWEAEGLRTQGRYFFDIDRIEAGRQSFQNAINLLQQTAAPFDEAMCWIDYGYRMPDRDSLFNEKTACLTHSIDLFHRLGKIDQEVWAMRARAEMYRRQGRLGLAEAELRHTLQLQQEHHQPGLHETFNILSETAMFRGDYGQAVMYGLQAVENMQSTADTIYAGRTYERLGNIYSGMSEHQESLYWFQRALQFYQVSKDKETIIEITALLANELTALGRPRDALQKLDRLMTGYRSHELIIRESISRAIGTAYMALGNETLAAKYLNEMMQIERTLKTGNLHSTDAYFAAGQLSIRQGQFAKAEKLLDTAMTAMKGRVPVARIRDINLALFVADSAQGRIRDGVTHLQIFHRLNDSIFNANSVKQIHDIQARYAVREKEKDIQALQKLAQTQQAQIRQSELLKKQTYAGIVMLLLLVAILYIGYRTKQRHARVLESKQQEIGEKNEALQKLLGEKEWLVRELHHRVKNNLQILTSLLDTQSRYLDNATARKAVSEGRDRMQAIALVHQKLYRPASNALIDMRIYITEFVHYLKESLTDSRRIYFDVRVDTIELGMSAAVSVGLIIHEAVTNAIKHAFTGRTRGAISVHLQPTDETGHLRLVIGDNGNGLAPGIDFTTGDSLGIRLMHIFCDQLDGRMTISNDPGFTLTIVFPFAGSKKKYIA